MKRVLIVDPDPETAAELGSRLSGLGYVVLEPAHSAGAAYEYLAREMPPPDIAIMSTGIGGDIGSIEAAVYVRTRFDVPVVLSCDVADRGIFQCDRRDDFPFAFLVRALDDRIIDAVLATASRLHRLEKRERTERLRAHTLRQRQALAVDILRILNAPDPLKDSIKSILAAIQNETGAEAAAIRLRSGDDYPYYCLSGFPDGFAVAENGIAERDRDGCVVLDPAGRPRLECACGLVIAGNADGPNPLITVGGSVLTNDAVSDFDLPKDRDPRYCPRNHCVLYGYRSIALIPIHAEGEVIGLLQLNDRRTHRFTRELVLFLEDISASIGVALLRRRAEEKAKREKQLYEALSRIYEPMMRSNISLPEVASIILDQAKVLTRSGYGFVSIVDEDTGENVCLTPPGHIAGAEFLTVPVRLEGDIVGQIALANPSAPYTEDDLDAIRRLAEYHSIAIRRSRDERILIRSEERFRTVIENIDEYVYSVDYEDGVPKECYHSPKCRDITGYEPADFQADPRLWFRTVHPDDRRKVIDSVKRSGAGPDPVSTEFRIIRKDGAVSWILNTWRMQRDANGKPSRIHGFIIDMNRRVLMEQELRDARRIAEDASRAKSDFLAAMSHELRTPLNAIFGFSQLLAMDGASGLSEKHRAYVEDIRSSGEHLLNVIGDILDLSKIEAGKIDLVKKPFDLGETLRKIFESMRPLADEKGVRLTADIAPDIGVLEADEVRVRQVLYNLLSNAIKFTGGGKAVGLRAAAAGSSAEITVWDEGIGIAEEDQRRVFESFEQVRRIDADAAILGTGLGLPIVRQLVELHGGRVLLESALGAGSRFMVVFPGRAEDHRARPAPPLPDAVACPRPGAPARGQASGDILVVEDTPLNQKLISAILGKWGYSVTMAPSGERAIELVREKDYALILMDINLPGIDGIETMKRIRSLRSEGEPADRRAMSRRMPIIALSAYSLKSDQERFMAEGMDAVLCKPIDFVKLRKIVSGYLSPGVPVPPDDVFGRLGAVGAIDVGRGLSFFGDDRGFYAELLGIFFRSYSSFPEALSDAFRKRDLLEARRLAHTMKGASATLALGTVEAAARELESRLSTAGGRPSGDPNPDDLLDALRVVLDALRETQNEGALQP